MPGVRDYNCVFPHTAIYRDIQTSYIIKTTPFEGHHYKLEMKVSTGKLFHLIVALEILSHLTSSTITV